MKLASVTLTNSTNDLIIDALKSVVDWVDACILINTSGKTQEFLKEKEVAGNKIVVVNYKPLLIMEDTAIARNFGLKAAYELGYSWACILDTDERMVINDEDIRHVLSNTPAETFLVNYVDNFYTKDRFVRLPARAEFVGATHEVYEGFKTNRLELDKVKFWEIQKTEEQQKEKSKLIIEAIMRDFVNRGENARGWYYMGDAQRSLGETKKAIDAFLKCGEMNQWDEESAFAYFRAAECYSELEDFDKVVECCKKGILIHPGLPELPWFISFAYFKLKQYRNAICWAHMALGTGKMIGCGKYIAKQCFRYEPGSYEKPYDVLRYSYQALGLNQEAAKYEIKFMEAEQARLRAK